MVLVQPGPLLPVGSLARQLECQDAPGLVDAGRPLRLDDGPTKTHHHGHHTVDAIAALLLIRFEIPSWILLYRHVLPTRQHRVAYRGSPIRVQSLSGRALFSSREKQILSGHFCNRLP